MHCCFCYLIVLPNIVLASGLGTDGGLYAAGFPDNRIIIIIIIVAAIILFAIVIAVIILLLKRKKAVGKCKQKFSKFVNRVRSESIQ